MKHLGDITKISGYDAPIVDVVIGGSPCQDLSVAGKRAGLDGERSRLFMEQIRIIKEMRERDKRNGRTNDSVRPRYMVWENVPGAFSSNGGEDFRVVLEETAKVCDEDANISKPKERWSNNGSIVGDGWSIAWRVFDAQFWGVPQRRRRISLVADFGGESASEILFIRNSVSRDSNESGEKRKDSTSSFGGSVGANDRERKTYAGNFGLVIRYGNQLDEDKTPTLATCLGDNTMSVVIENKNNCELTKTYTVDMGGGKSAVDIHEDRSPTLTCTHYGEPAVVYDARGNGDGKTVPTMTGDHQNRITDYTGVVVEMDRASYNQGKNAQFDMGITEDGVAHTVIAKGPGAVAYETKPVDCRNGIENDTNGALQSNMAHSINGNNVVRVKYIVRRLTPMECERLQGYPDGWTDIGEWYDSKGKKHESSDASRYKALGNSISLPNWKWVLKRLCACYERDVTMASLFDGIGGFPYLWEQMNGKGTCLWASEIEEFPIAVTERRINGK